MFENKQEEYEYVTKNGFNEKLVRKLQSFRSYLNEDLPEWKQLIALGGFVIDVIRELKWEEQPEFSRSGFQFDKKPIMTCDEVCDGISSAVDNHILAPLADELNAMWSDWNCMKTEKYKNVQTIDEMERIIFARLEQTYPGIEKWVRHYFIRDEETEKPFEMTDTGKCDIKAKNTMGSQIRRIRQMRGLTQKQLGVAVCFDEKTASVRIAQYESGTRTPKESVIKALAVALGVHPAVLHVPDIRNGIGLIQTLFALEDLYGLHVCSHDGTICLTSENEELTEMMTDWAEKSELLKSGKIGKEEYDNWRYNYVRKEK